MCIRRAQSPSLASGRRGAAQQTRHGRSVSSLSRRASDPVPFLAEKKFGCRCFGPATRQAPRRSLRPCGLLLGAFQPHRLGRIGDLRFLWRKHNGLMRPEGDAPSQVSRSRGPRLWFFRRVDEAPTTESTAEGLRSRTIREAQTNMESLGDLSAPATVDPDAAFAVESLKLPGEHRAGSPAKPQLDQMRKCCSFARPTTSVLRRR
jgi:hypothetical protein